MKENKKVFGLFLEIGVLVISSVLFFVISVILGAGLLNVLGFEYTSISSVVIFFLMYTLTAVIVEPFVEAYVMAITELGRFNKLISEVIGFIFCIGFDVVLLSLIESMIDGIRISDRTIILFSMITYICSRIFEEVVYKEVMADGATEEAKKVKRGFKKKKRKSEE